MAKPRYKELEYPRALVAVDLVIFTIIDTDLKVLLIERGLPPFEGQRALPGGFVRVGPSAKDQGEDLDAAARRELAEETGLPAEALYLEQLHTFGTAGRDPRGRVISVAYYALVRKNLAPFVQAGGDARGAGWVSCSEVDRAALAFDHGAILDRAIAGLERRVDDSDIAFELLPETFTVLELREVHEVIHGTRYDPANFRRRFKRMQEDGVIAQAPGKRSTGRRPARVYRFRGRKPGG